MYSAGGYNFSSYGRSGKEPNNTIGKQHVGNYSLKYLYSDEDELDEDEEKDEEDEDGFDINSFGSKIVNSLPMGITDPYAHRSTDHAAGQLKNTGGSNIFEFAGDHTTPIRIGISPYAQPKHSGPPLGGGGSSQAFKTTGNFKRTGTHRPHGYMAVNNDESIFNLSEFLNDDNNIDLKNFRHQQNRVKRVLMSIGE